LNELKRFPVGERDLDECFKYFSVLHEVLNSREILRRIVREVFEDFRSDNVVYLELRTTPRCIKNPNTGEILVSKVEYVRTVIEAIKEFEKEGRMLIKLIISVDRAKGLQDGMENIQLSQIDELRYYIVGIDFSGNPKSISFKDLHSLFELCRQCKLKVTVHIGEHWQDADVDYILEEIRPDRIGHAVCLSNNCAVRANSSLRWSFSSVMVPTVERDERTGLVWSMAIAGGTPSTLSTAGLSMRSRNWRA